MFHLDILTNIENFIYTEEETLQFIEESIPHTKDLDT